MRELAEDLRPLGLRFAPNTIVALQEGAEAWVVDLFEKTRGVATHAGRKTVLPRDMRLVIDLGGGLL